MDCSPPVSSVHGTSQAKILNWVAISFSRGSSKPKDWTCFSSIAVGFFTTEPPGKRLFCPGSLNKVLWNKSQEHSAKWKKSDTEDRTLYDPFIWKVQNCQIHRDRKQIGGSLGVRVGTEIDWKRTRSCFLEWWNEIRLDSVAQPI